MGFFFISFFLCVCVCVCVCVFSYATCTQITAVDGTKLDVPVVCGDAGVCEVRAALVHVLRRIEQLRIRRARVIPCLIRFASYFSLE